MLFTTKNMIKIVLLVLGLVGLVYAMKKESFTTPETTNVVLTDVPQIAEAQMLEDRTSKADLNAEDLLPKDTNSAWDKVNPSNGQGTVAFKNFLEAGNMFGVDTQGSSLRNANQGLRSEPLIKQMEVSPWSQSTIDPDIYRKPLESSCRQ